MSRRLPLACLGLVACVGPPRPTDEDAPDTDPMADTGPPVDPDWICAPDDVVCDGSCTAVRFDEQACGDCDTVCAEDEVCDEGTCVERLTAPACDAEARAEVLAPATAESPTVELTCSLTLDPTDVVTKKIRLTGPAASGVTLDCDGARLTEGVAQGGADTVLVQSLKTGELTWDRPSDITVRDCHVEGSVRIVGQGLNGEGEDVRLDSLTEGHRERAQRAAPTRVLLEGLTIEGDGRIPVYLSPGATEITLRDSTLAGRTVSTVVYLDAESAHNTLVGNTFDAEMEGSPLRREVLAVDGSADNVIAGNVFAQPEGGGIFVYRNCGEGGTVRHQEPRRNLITGNLFRYDVAAAMPPVWVGSRGSASLYRIYCPLDDGYDFGSSLDDDDFAKQTVIVGNRFVGETDGAPLRVDDEPTLLEDNEVADEDATGPVSCVRFRHEAAPRVVAEGDASGGHLCRDGRLE